MKSIARLNILLSPEQLKAMEGVLHKRELTLESFNLLRKDYTRVKSKVKKIEKKLLVLIEEEGSDSFFCRFLEYEIAHIENKYKAIEQAISRYNATMKSFNDFIASPTFLSFYRQDDGNYSLNHLNNYLNTATTYINDASNAIRITGRYFKNIADMQKSHAKLQEAIKQRKRREWQNEANSTQGPVPPAQV